MNHKVMTTSDLAEADAYTDAPHLHPNPVVASLQLLFWLFFHPSAWRNHIYRIDPNLRPSFSLTQLSRRQWQNPELRRLLWMGYGVLPGATALLVGITLWGLGLSPASILLGMVVSLLFAVGAGLTGSLILGTAVSIVAGLAIGTAGGVGVGLGFELGIGISPIRGTPAEVSIEALIFSASFGIFFGISGSLISGVAQAEMHYSPLRQAAGMLVGVVVSSLFFFWGGLFLAERVLSLGMMIVLTTIPVGVSVSWGQDRLAGLIMMVTVGLGLSLAYQMPTPFAFHIALFGPLGIPPFMLAKRIAGPWPGAIATAFGSSAGWLAHTLVLSGLPLWPTLPLSLLSILLGLSLFVWRPLILYPFLMAWNVLICRFDKGCSPEKLSLLRKHSAFWDEHQPLRLVGLPDYLLRVMARSPIEGQAALDYLSSGRQRWAAQAVQIELEARWLAACTEVEVIGTAYRRLSAGELTGPASALLRSFSRLSRDVMAALQQTSAYNQRLALNAVEERLDSLLRELTRSNEPYAPRFRPIAAAWRQQIAGYSHQLAEMVEKRQEIENPYVIGVPLTEQQEIFVGRTDISARIEQLLLDQQRSPLLLYGQRRMGKTSLLNNLGRLLPTTIVPLFVDLQGPASRASDYTGFLYNIARGMIGSAQRQRGLILPPLSREALAQDPFTRFDEWLDEVEATLGESTALLAFDEFEALDTPLAEGRFNESTLLGMFRNLVQHRRRFKILLTGSHTLAEFHRWASYLINIQTIHISYLNSQEARQLVEQPVQGFALQYEPEASDQVLYLTRCHPFLVQLLCAEVVALKNEQDPAARRRARLADVEAAVPEALGRGSFFFADIERNQIDPAGLTLLRFMATQGEGVWVSRETLASHGPEALEPTLALLVRRELIEVANGAYRFQVELIRRWFARS